jgi:hypothetical protein
LFALADLVEGLDHKPFVLKGAVVVTKSNAELILAWMGFQGHSEGFL